MAAVSWSSSGLRVGCVVFVFLCRACATYCGGVASRVPFETHHLLDHECLKHCSCLVCRGPPMNTKVVFSLGRW